MSAEIVDLRPPEFQAVLVVDYDNRLYPLTETMPTCLLPIANRKLLAYQFDVLVKSGVAETFVVTPEEYEEPIKQFLREYSGRHPNMSIDVIVVESLHGSGDGLRAVSDRIVGDFFYLSSDFISQVSLADLVALHRSSCSDLTMMLSSPPKEFPVDELDVEYVALSDEGRLLMSTPALAVEGSISLPKHLMHRVSSFNLRNNLQDLGVYLMSHWVIDLVAKNQRISSLKSDLVPFLIERQFQSKEYLFEAIPALKNRKRPLSVIDNWLTSAEQRHKDLDVQTILDASEKDSDDLLRCFAIVYEPPSSSAADAKSGAAAPVVFVQTRITSIPTYLNVNKSIPLVNYTSRNPWARVTNYQKKEMSVIGENVDMGSDKSVTFKQCFIGSNCKIGNGVKLNNCVIMDNVVIGDNCVIQNCVICDRVVIDANCNLNECNVGSAYKMSSGTRVKGESFANGSH